MTTPELILVVPCYNEAARLDATAFLQFVDAHPSLQFLFVDDGSTDHTREVLERMREAAPAAVHVLPLAPNQGKAEAVRAGVLAALAHHPALVGFLDADLSTPLDVMDDFLAVLRARPALEFVIGARVMLLGRDVRRSSLRHYVGRVFATAVSVALDLPVYDTQCGAKVLRVTDTTATLFATPFRSRWVFDAELIGRYLRLPVAPGELPHRDRLYELVVSTWHDIPGSKVRWYDVPRAALDIARLWKERVTRPR